PNWAGWCDSAHQQITSVSTLGNEYSAVRHGPREGTDEEYGPWHLIGVVDGTTLSYSPKKPNGAPLTLSKGQTIEFYTDFAVVVRSQDANHPFMLAQYMTGATAAGLNGAGQLGDPEFVLTISNQQFLNDYVFFSDPTYSYSQIVVVRQKGDNGYQDV